MKKLLFIFLLCFSQFSSAADCSAAIPFHDGFYKLEGTHASAKCGCGATCHRNSVFVGTPKSCKACHTTATYGGLNPAANHIPTTLECDTCHRSGSVSFANGRMNHIGIVAGCVTCHGGTQFEGVRPRTKGSGHIPTTASCETCHQSTNSWDASFSHQGVVAGSCASCHNNTFARGKSVNHIPTTLSCDSCHKNYTSFIGVSASNTHAGVSSGCTTCHNGAYLSSGAVGVSSKVNHSTFPGTCETCHVTTTWACSI